MGTSSSSCSIICHGLNGDWRIHSCGKFWKILEGGNIGKRGKFWSVHLHVCCLFVCVFIYIKTVAFAFIQHLIIQSGIAWQELTITF